MAGGFNLRTECGAYGAEGNTVPRLQVSFRALLWLQGVGTRVKYYRRIPLSASLTSPFRQGGQERIEYYDRYIRILLKNAD